jgi:hypothetical protein
MSGLRQANLYWHFFAIFSWWALNLDPVTQILRLVRELSQSKCWTRTVQFLWCEDPALTVSVLDSFFFLESSINRRSA